jgi:protein phosphatase
MIKRGHQGSQPMNADSLADTTELPAVKPSESLMEPPTTAVRLELAARTHPGNVRPNNEDNFHVVQIGRYLRTLMSSLPDGEVPSTAEEVGYAFAVADGMGGMAAGEVASRLAITLLVEHALQTPDWIMGREEPFASRVLDRFAQRFHDVNEAVVDIAETAPGLRGMGTTLSVALSFGNDLVVTHVGDSPVFLWRRGALVRLTRDHTVGEKLVRLGMTDVGKFHHVLTHAIGIRGTGGEPDLRRHRLADGDRLLLCTDGLTDMVDDETVGHELGRDASADTVCRSLVDLALAKGGKDNVTVVVASYRIPPGPEPRTKMDLGSS